MIGKFKKVLCSLLLALSLMVSSILGPVNAQAATIYDESDAEAAELSTVLITTGTTADLEKIVTYSIETTAENEVVPFDIPAKGYLDFYVASNISSEVAIFADENCTKKAGYSVYISSSSEQLQAGVYGENGKAFFPEAGTYYVKFSKPGAYLFSSQMFSGENRTLKDNTYTTAYGYKYESFNYDSNNIYYKYTPSKTGYISISTEYLSDSGSSYITLCNSSKKAISEEVYTNTTYSSGKVVFAVKKGATYYIKVKTSSEKYRIKSKITGITESSGTKKSNAKTLTIGKERKGILLTEDKTSSADWYKFTLSKATKLNLTVAGNASSVGIKVELTSANIGGSVDVNISGTDYKRTTSLETFTSATLPKGTYYIRVYKGDKKASGNYSIKVSKR